MEDDDPEDLYGSQEVAGESKDRPPLEVVALTVETEVPTDQAELWRTQSPFLSANLCKR